MNTISNKFHTSLLDLPGEILNAILWDMCPLSTLGLFHQVSKGFKLFIEEKNLFERYLSQDIPQGQQLLEDFYQHESLPPLKRFICRSYSLLKNGVPYLHLRKFLAESFVDGKVRFIKSLDQKFRNSFGEDTSCLMRLCFFAQDSNQRVSAHAHGPLTLLIYNARYGAAQINPLKLDSILKLSANAYEKTTIQQAIFRAFIIYTAFLGISLISAFIVPMSLIFALSIIAIALNAVELFPLIQCAVQYIEYGHCDSSVYRSLALLIPCNLILLGNILLG